MFIQGREGRKERQWRQKLRKRREEYQIKSNLLIKIKIKNIKRERNY